MKLITDDGKEIALESIKVVEYKPDSVLVFNVGEKALSCEECEELKEIIDKVFQKDGKPRVLILHGGIEIEVIKEKSDDK